MDCVECKSKVTAPTTIKNYIMTPSGLVRAIPCYNCGRVHKQDGSGFDECSGRQYFKFPGDQTWTLKPPK
jgi:hypothetical protein